MNNQKKYRLLLAAVMSLSMGFALTACNDKEESTSDGDLEVAQLKALVLDSIGQIAFDTTQTSGVYKIGLVNLDDARELAAMYAGDGFTGQAYTRILPNDRGLVKINIGQDGVFYEVQFGVSGIQPFTLNITDGYEGGNTLGVTHTCPVCKLTFMSLTNRCPRTNDKKYHPKK